MPRSELRKLKLDPAGNIGRTAVLILLVTALTWIASCSSDDPNAVGIDLVDTEIDALLEAMDITELPAFRGIPIKDIDKPFLDQEVLYLGKQQGYESSILVEFDLDQVLNETITLEMFDQANIGYVNLRMLMLSRYSEPDSTLEDPLEIAPWKTFYELYHVDDPINAEDYPGTEPSKVGKPNLNEEIILDDATRVEISIFPGEVSNWMNEGGIQTFMIQEGLGSGDGLVGYSSMDMLHGGTTLDSTIDFDSLGPSLNVKLVAQDTTITIPPVADISTFHTLVPVPDDPTNGFILRTGLRSYPAMHFDFSGLPEDIFINRAVLAVASDTTTSWGTLESIVVSEIDLDLIEAVGDTMTLDELGAATTSVVGMTNLSPTLHRRMEFNVTVAVQRMINGVYDGTRGFVLTPGEDFLPSYDLTSLDPDFYFNQFNFYGTADPDPLLRPMLKITYSVNETIQGGGK